MDRRRKEELTRNSTGFREAIEHNPYLSLAAAPVAGALTGSLALLVHDPSSPLGTLANVTVAVAAMMPFLSRGFGQLRHQGSQAIEPQPGEEKQLLMAIRDSDGLTAVEAALETSLTVDDADKLLSRLAERGHLHLQSRNGALFYVLPGRRGLEGHTAPEA